MRDNTGAILRHSLLQQYNYNCQLQLGHKLELDTSTTTWYSATASGIHPDIYNNNIVGTHLGQATWTQAPTPDIKDSL